MYLTALVKVILSTTMKRAFKWIARILGGLVILLLVAAVVMYAMGSSKLSRTFDVSVASLVIPTDSVSLARGEHIVATSGCRMCHGENLAGTVMVDAPPFRFVAPNLTSGAGGVGSQFSAEDFDRAIRHGVAPDGRFLMIMPSSALHELSDTDASALIAYLQQIPPVDNELPLTQFHVLGKIMAATFSDEDAYMEVRVDATKPESPEPGPTSEYGAYLAGGLCAYCHGEDLAGMETPPGPPGMLPSPSLAAAGLWTLDQFRTMMRTGVTASGREVDEEFMPVDITKHYSDEDLEALHAYLGTL